MPDKFHQIVLTLVAIALLASMPATFAAGLKAEKSFSIEPQPLATALSEFARQADLQILFRPDAVAGLTSGRIVGTYPVSAALERLLQGTKLSYQFLDDRTVTVSSVPNTFSSSGEARRVHLAQAEAPSAATNASMGEAPEQSAAVIEEVIVTAQKREERLQDVPISITAVTGEQLEQRGVNGLSGLNAIAPNVMFRENPGQTLTSVVSIRGSVTSQPAIWVDPSVGLYLNGVYLGKSVGSIFDVVDIERVEVLRGPQGTLFGRNTEGGAINFITREPSGEYRGSVGVEYGNFEHKVAKASVDLPRFGIASVSFGLRKEERDGWAKNLTGPDLGAVDNEAARASLKLDFSDTLQARYDFDYSNTDNTPIPASLYSLSGWRGSFPSIFGPFLGTAIERELAPYVTTARPETVSTNHPAFREIGRTKAHSLTLRYQVSDKDELKYIFARRDMYYAGAQDQDGTPLESFALAPGVVWGLESGGDKWIKYDQDSHELQWVGSRGGFRYVVGIYYFKDDGETHSMQNFSLFGSPPLDADFASGTRAKAIFGQADYAITDRWSVTLGARYTEEEKTGWSHRYLTNGFDGPPISDILPLISYSEDFSDTTPMMAISFKPNDDLNFYARVAKGFKSGGFSSELADPRVATPYEPQSSVSTEIGMKSMLLDGRARLNISLYNTDITDQQTTQLLPGTTQSLMVNAGESTYKGVEVEAELLIREGWRVQLGYGYLNAKYDKFIDNSFLPPATPGGPLRTGGPLIDTASNRLPPYAPEHTLNLTFDGRLFRAAWGELRAIFDVSYVSKMYLYPVNKSLTAINAGGSNVVGIDEIPSLPNLNARLLLAGVSVGSGELDVSLWGRNLTDEDKPVQGIDFSMFRNVFWQEPRTYMITGTYKW